MKPYKFLFIKFYNFNGEVHYHHSLKLHYHHSLKLFNFRVWSFYYMKGFGWFRLLGMGLRFKDLTRCGLTFGERMGINKYIKIGKWQISNVNI